MQISKLDCSIDKNLKCRFLYTGRPWGSTLIQRKTSEEASRIEKDFRDRIFFRGRLQMSSLVWRETLEIDNRLCQVVKGGSVLLYLPSEILCMDPLQISLICLKLKLIIRKMQEKKTKATDVHSSPSDQIQQRNTTQVDINIEQKLKGSILVYKKDDYTIVEDLKGRLQYRRISQRSILVYRKNNLYTRVYRLQFGGRILSSILVWWKPQRSTLVQRKTSKWILIQRKIYNSEIDTSIKEDWNVDLRG